ncbi:hypothetical protein DVH26_23385 [Paenibacillus sp. H1-7]|uniref:hypothetical protein n=1 Tax=Paenibacillus sp. H1-7 TaxID=2282849 RepID=UPI001EF96298|nr:hypothetical protein [Paenibacillus sp. H1-7]ULL17125.1 hypothetical protein DVH26_23385 [Paenibacillus sp. H1-7]
MKRYLIWLMVALMTLSIAACSSKGSVDTGAAPTAAASKTPSPTETPKPTPTPAPSETPKQTATPAPSETPKPTETPAPTEAPKPTATPAPAEAPKTADAKTPVEAPKPAESTPAPVVAPAPAAAPAPQKEEVSPKDKKLLLVGRENAPDDAVVATRLKALGFKVTNMIDREFTAEETKGYDLIYISQTVNSKVLKEGIMKDVAIPTVYVKNHGMFYLGLSSVEENTNVFDVKSIDIVDGNHKVAGGLSGSVDIYKETNSKIGISYGVPGKEAKIIATAPGDAAKAAIYYYDKGAKADNGYETKARISFFYLNNGLHENTTDNGWKLLDNLVVWTLQNG